MESIKHWTPQKRLPFVRVLAREMSLAKIAKFIPKFYYINTKIIDLKKDKSRFLIYIRYICIVNISLKRMTEIVRFCKDLSLTGDRKGQYAIRINRQLRVCLSGVKEMHT